MSQTISPMGGFAPEVPDNLQCGFCKKPVEGVFYRTLNRFACSNCADQVKTVAARNVITPASFLRALAAGLVVGVGCAVAWGVIVKVTGWSIGIIASFIGIAVGKAIYKASGKRRGPALQWLAAGLSVLGIAGGKLVWVSLFAPKSLANESIPVNPRTIATFIIYNLTNAPSIVFQGIDLLWIGIAVYAAFRLLKRPALTVAGPYPMTPAADAGLQFHTVEPVAEPIPADPAPEQP